MPKTPDDRCTPQQVGATVVIHVSRQLFGIRSGCGRAFRGHKEMLLQ